MAKKTRSQPDLSSLARALVAEVEKMIHAAAPDHAAATALRRRVWKGLWECERSAAGKSRASPARGSTACLDQPHAKRTVLFVGAGASAAFGFPVTNQILPEIWDALHERSGKTWRTWAGFKPTKNRPLQTEAAVELKHFLCGILPGLDASKEGTPTGASIVDVISMLEHSTAERQSPFPPATYTAPGVKLMQPASELLRARHLLTMAINGVLDGREDNRLRERLARWIIDRSGAGGHPGGERRVTVISTNYDTSLERPLYEKAAAWPGGVPQNIDLGLTWRDRGGSLHSRRLDAPLAVFKLHGSLDWLRCETCGGVTINTAMRIASLDSWEVKREYNTCECGGLLKSLLVTPSIVRNIRDANLLSLWNAALEELRCADEWIFAGYSLPSEDVAIRSLLLRALHSRRTEVDPAERKPKPLRVRVVLLERDDPAPPGSPADAYRALFPEEIFSETDYSSEGFKAWFEKVQAGESAEGTSLYRRRRGSQKSRP